MFVRLVLLLIVAGGVFAAWRARRLLRDQLVEALARRVPPPDPPPPLEPSEIEDLERLSADAPRLGKALALRVRIRELRAVTDTSGAGWVDQAIRQLGRQADTRARIDATLAGKDLAAVHQAVAAARGRVTEAEDEAARLDAEGTLRGLEEQAEHLERLQARRDEVDQVAADTFVALENVHLALLDASSSRAGVGAGNLRSLQASLMERAEALRLRTEAEEEVERLLRS